MAYKVTEAEIELMWSYHNQGFTYKAIGKKLRRSPDTVSKYVKLREATIAMATQLVEAYATANLKP